MAELAKHQQLNRLAFGTPPPYFANMVAVQLQRVEDDQAHALKALEAAQNPAPDDPFEEFREMREHWSWLGRMRMDTHLLLVGVGALLKLARRFAKLTGDARVDKAERAFFSVAPQAKHFRDVFEHADDYVLGEGRLQQDGTLPVDEQQIGVELTGPEPDDEIEIVLDSWRLPLKALAAAAIQLAPELDAVWRDHAKAPPASAA